MGLDDLFKILYILGESVSEIASAPAQAVGMGRSMMNVKSIIGVVVCTVWILGASSVLAGEVNGNGDVIPGGVNGASICSFSGQQDDGSNEGVFRDDMVQSWGQIPKALRDFLLSIGAVPHPGDACNPNNAEPEV